VQVDVQHQGRERAALTQAGQLLAGQHPLQEFEQGVVGQQLLDDLEQAREGHLEERASLTSSATQTRRRWERARCSAWARACRWPSRGRKPKERGSNRPSSNG